MISTCNIMKNIARGTLMDEAIAGCKKTPPDVGALDVLLEKLMASSEEAETNCHKLQEDCDKAIANYTTAAAVFRQEAENVFWADIHDIIISGCVGAILTAVLVGNSGTVMIVPDTVTLRSTTIIVIWLSIIALLGIMAGIRLWPVCMVIVMSIAVLVWGIYAAGSAPAQVVLLDIWGIMAWLGLKIIITTRVVLGIITAAAGVGGVMLYVMEVWLGILYRVMPVLSVMVSVVMGILAAAGQGNIVTMVLGYKVTYVLSVVFMTLFIGYKFGGIIALKTVQDMLKDEVSEFCSLDQPLSALCDIAKQNRHDIQKTMTISQDLKQQSAAKLERKKSKKRK